MLELDFQKNLDRIRDNVSQGIINESVAELTQLLMTLSDKHKAMTVHLDLSILSMVSGDLEESHNNWQQARQLIDAEEEPERLKVFDAYFHAVGKHYRKALMSEFEAPIMANPNEAEYYLIRGMCYLEMEQYRHAQADFERALALKPNDVIIKSLLAESYMNIGKHTRAVSLNEEALEVCPSLRRSLINLGILYFDSGRFEESYRLFQCLIGYEPLNWFAWTCLGDIRVEMPGKTFQALPAYSAAIVAGTTIPQTYINLAKGLFMLGRYHRAISVLDYYEAVQGEWAQADLETVLAFRLIVDILDNPGLAKNQRGFSSRLRKIKALNNKAAKILLQILASSVSFDYSDDIMTIFERHMTAFIQLAVYMHLCNDRMISVEESILLGVMARSFLWNGFLFEAQAIIRMLSNSNDTRINDMCTEILNEIYKYNEMSAQSGIDIAAYHEWLIHFPGSEKTYNMLISGNRDDIPYDANWRRILIHYLEDDSMDIGKTLFYAPILDSIEKLSQKYGNSKDFPIQLTRFWHLCQNYALAKAQKSDAVPDSSSIADMPASWTKIFEEIKKSYDVHIDEKEQASHAAEDFFKFARYDIHHHSFSTDISFESIVQNDNGVQVCSASPNEALAGYEPLPFTVDGTAFKRILETPSLTILDETTVETVLNQLKDRHLMLLMRGLTNEAIHKEDAEKYGISSDLMDDITKIWHMIHGQEDIDSNLLVMPKSDKTRRYTTGIAISLSNYNTVLKHLIMSSSTDAITQKGWRLPWSPLIASPIRLLTQHAPKTPKSAQILNQTVSGQLITQVDLAEQFFNRAVVSIHAYLESREPEDLSLFFEDDTYIFHTFESCETALQNKTEVEAEKGLIQNEQELAHSIDQIYKRGFADYLRINYDDYERFNKGVVPHPFMLQFKNWADSHSALLYPKIAHLECMTDQFKASEQYLIIWRLTDILKRYPFLSRAYLLLARVYVHTNEIDNVLKSIKSGEIWEQKLYAGAGWLPISSQGDVDESITPIEAGTEFEDTQPLIWAERFIFLGRDESMYHYSDYGSSFAQRAHRFTNRRAPVERIINNDKCGAYEFYRLFNRFFTHHNDLQRAWMSAMTKPGVYSLRDYMSYCLLYLEAPDSFPIRRELAEMLYQLYPTENPGALARFYCDNLQPANALPHAAYAYFIGNANDEYDEMSQSAATLGCLLYDMGDMGGAVEFLRRAIQEASPTPMAYLTLGCACIELQRYEEAIEYLNEGKVIDPTSDRFYYNLSLAYFEMGNFESAEKAIKAGLAISDYPSDLNLQMMRIDVHYGRYIDALPRAQHIVKEDPDMFISAILFPEFSTFRQLEAVRSLITDCGFDLSILDDNKTPKE